MNAWARDCVDRLAPFRCRVCRAPLWIRAICSPCVRIEADVRREYRARWTMSTEYALEALAQLSTEELKQLMGKIYDENVGP